MKKDLSSKEIGDAINSVTLKDKEKLKNWLIDSGRRYLVFDAANLVDSLSFPEGLRLFQSIIDCYRNYRMGIPTGIKRSEKNSITNEYCEVDVMHDEMLSTEELDKAIRYLINQITDIDPNWKL